MPVWFAVRKGYHGLAVALFLPAAAWEPQLLGVSLAIAFALLAAVELVRVADLPLIGEPSCVLGLPHGHAIPRATMVRLRDGQVRWAFHPWSLALDQLGSLGKSAPHLVAMAFVPHARVATPPHKSHLHPGRGVAPACLKCVRALGITAQRPA